MRCNEEDSSLSLKETAMKRFALTFAAVALVTTSFGSVQGADGYWYGGQSHANTHANLAHQAQHRSAIHHNAHHYPQTGYQHSALHANLNHQAQHARSQHRATHNYGTYGQGYNGYSGGFYGGQFGGYRGGQTGGYYGDHGISVRTPVGSLWLHH